MRRRFLKGWRDRPFWLLLFLSLVILFCVYRISLPLPLFINLGTESDGRYLLNFHREEQGEFYRRSDNRGAVCFSSLSIRQAELAVVFLPSASGNISLSLLKVGFQQPVSFSISSISLTLLS